MGKSYTYHVIGQSAIYEEGGKQLRQSYPAMNRVEIAQVRVKAVRDGHPITVWYCQTRVGERILGDAVLDRDVLALLPKMVTCPVCLGRGHNGQWWCPVCNGSGICRPGNERNWQAWQIEHMKAEAGNAAIPNK